MSVFGNLFYVYSMLSKMDKIIALFRQIQYHLNNKNNNKEVEVKPQVNNFIVVIGSDNKAIINNCGDNCCKYR